MINEKIKKIMSLFTSYFHANIMYVGIQNDISRDRKKKNE